MSERSKKISKLLSDPQSRASYIRAKLGILVPSQIRALRLRRNMPRQSDLAKAAEMHQSRISMFETPGAANVTLETLSRLASAFDVGLVVKFVPFSEMLRWENDFSQDVFNVTRLQDDAAFLSPEEISPEVGIAAAVGSGNRLGASPMKKEPYSDREISAARVPQISAMPAVASIGGQQ